MKPESQIAILKTIVKWQAEEIEALEKALLEKDELIGSVNGLDAELRVHIQTPDEHAWCKRQRWGKATQTPVPLWTTGGRNGSKATA
jgi:hypothetical protein